MNPANTVFTIGPAGRYFITYNLNATAALAANSRLIVNGTPVGATVRNALLNIATFSADIILNLAAGSTVSLQLFGLITVTTLQAGQGASLTIIRLDDEII